MRTDFFKLNLWSSVTRLIPILCKLKLQIL